jgi:hypothetical protein
MKTGHRGAGFWLGFIRWPEDGKERAGGEWSSAVRRGVVAAEGAGQRALGWGGHGRVGGRAGEPC